MQTSKKRKKQANETTKKPGTAVSLQIVCQGFRTPRGGNLHRFTAEGAFPVFLSNRQDAAMHRFVPQKRTEGRAVFKLGFTNQGRNGAETRTRSRCLRLCCVLESFEGSCGRQRELLGHAPVGKGRDFCSDLPEHAMLSHVTLFKSFIPVPEWIQLHRHLRGALSAGRTLHSCSAPPSCSLC